jgi:copper oxidase (laccase) domain-containing protein
LITSKKLLKQKKISHGFFNRNGGKSSGVYRSLNCGPGSNDKSSNVKRNLKIVKNKHW